MSIWKKFATDEKVELEGVWLDYGDGERVKIARAGGSNKRYITRIEDFRRKHKRQIDLELMANDAAVTAMIPIYADTIILAWEGFLEDDDKTAIPFTRENVIRVLTALPEMFLDIQTQAMNSALYREYIDEEDAKNS